MATALSMIKRAMRLAGVIGVGETPSDNEAEDGLEALNTMMNSWETQKLYVYQIQEDTFTWPANTQSPTVGSGGTFNMTLPARIADDCYFVTSDGTSVGAPLIDADAWAGIQQKSQTNTWGWWIYPVYGPSLITLNVYPIPAANISFVLASWQRLQSFSALTDVLALPFGYERAIVYSLAEEYGPEFGVEIQPMVMRIAATARRNLKRINSLSPVMMSEPGRMGWPYWANVYAGTPY